MSEHLRVLTLLFFPFITLSLLLIWVGSFELNLVINFFSLNLVYLENKNCLVFRYSNLLYTVLGKQLFTHLYISHRVSQYI